MRAKDESRFSVIVDFVNEYFDSYGRSPSTREIETGTKISAMINLQTEKIKNYDLPVEPKPPSPRWVSESSSTCKKAAGT